MSDWAPTISYEDIESFADNFRNMFNFDKYQLGKYEFTVGKNGNFEVHGLNLTVYSSNFKVQGNWADLLIISMIVVEVAEKTQDTLSSKILNNYLNGGDRCSLLLDIRMLAFMLKLDSKYPAKEEYLKSIKSKKKYLGTKVVQKGDKGWAPDDYYLGASQEELDELNRVTISMAESCWLEPNIDKDLWS